MSTKKASQQKKSKKEETLPYAHEKSDIAAAIRTCRAIINLDLFKLHSDRTVQKALFTELVIHLNDLLQKSADAGNRISFNDEIDPALDMDVTDLVNKIRICCCHLSTPQSLNQGGKFSWNLSYNNVPESVLNGQPSTSPTIDVSINYGVYFVHYERHMLRAFKQAEHYFLEVQKDPEVLRSIY